MYSPTQWEVYIKAEANIGTLLKTSMQAVNVDNVDIPDLNPFIVDDVRHGTGRTPKAVDNYESEKARLKTFTINGIADTTVFPILLQNALTVAIDGAIYKVAYNHTQPASMAHGDAGSALKTLSVCLVSPITNDTISLPGCVVTELSFNVNDIVEEGGRAKFSATFTTQYAATKNDSAPTGANPYTNGYYYISQLDTTKKVAGIADCVIGGFSFKIQNPVKYEGFQGSNGDPQKITRAVPGIIVEATTTVLYDDTAKAIKDEFGDNDNAKPLELSNHATFSSASGLGFQMEKANVKGIAFNDRTTQYLDVTQRALADTSGTMFGFIA